MSKLRKREGDNQDILEVQEILKDRGFSISAAPGPEELQTKEYIKRLYTNEFDRFPGEDIYQLLWFE